MAKVLYFDCFSGLSGPLALGALLDAGLLLTALQAELAKLSLDGWILTAECGQRGGLTGTEVYLSTNELSQA